MKKEEAKKLLYVFLKRHNLSEKYYYNCIMYNYRRNDKKEYYFALPKRKRLKVLMNEHCDWFFDEKHNIVVDGFFNYNAHAFVWRDTPEGFDYWQEWYEIWKKEMGNRVFEELEYK